MERTRFGGVCTVVIAAGLLALSACGSDHGTKAPAPQAAAASTQTETVLGEEYVETEATILAIDKETRNVTLRAANGRVHTIPAPSDVDLNRLKTGDVVLLGAYERLSVSILPPGSAPLGITREAAVAKAEPGTTPGRAVAGLTRVVSEVAAIDLANNRVTLRGADGNLRTLDVRNPDNQRKLTTLKVGDLVQMDLVEVVAAAIKPRS
jgi:hypothetical protein